MTTAAARLTVRDLSKEFSTAGETLSILEGVHLDLHAGENLSIVGPSGSGKSTLLYVLGTLDAPSRGTVELDGVDPFQLSSVELAIFRNTKIGFVFQDHHLLPQLTLVENILLPALAFGGASSELVQRADELMQLVGLWERRAHLPSQISGGERQRAAVARALLKRPPLVLADEPTGNLDADSGRRVAELLMELPTQQGAMLIVVTHNAELAQRAQRRMRLQARQLVEC
jgi:lipoprotein-releasing system ATP-binding protein